MQIRSDLNFRIAHLFREVGIKLPSPKQEVFVHGLENVTYEEHEPLSEHSPEVVHEKTPSAKSFLAKKLVNDYATR